MISVSANHLARPQPILNGRESHLETAKQSRTVKSKLPDVAKVYPPEMLSFLLP